MKITAINGSPHGKDGITNIMVTAFLKGAQEAGAEIVNIFLAEKEINHCKACNSCWFATPGQCIIQDDMAEILSLGQGTDILVLATPLKYANISSMLNVFIERLIVQCNPYFEIDPRGTRHPKKTAAAEAESSFYRSKLVMIASGALSTRDHFQAISHWVKKLAFYNHTEIIGEIYASQGLLIATQEAQLRPLIDNYLQLLENAGREIVTTNRLTDETDKLLAQNFIPDNIYVEQTNSFFDSLLSQLDHPYLKNQMNINKKDIIKDEIVQEILKKASEDKDFKQMLFDNPKEALEQFGIKIPDGSLANGLKDRRAFFAWFYKSILNELKDETDTTRHEDVDWHDKETYEFYWH